MHRPFSEDVVAAVCRHMDDDHAEASLLICRTLGGAPAASAARAVDVDAEAMHFTATVDGAPVPVRVAFAEPVAERPQIRTAVVALHERAQALAAPPLSAQLRSSTADAHAAVEASPSFAALAAGRVAPALVAALAARLLPVHEAIERCTAVWSDDPLVRPLLVPGLERAARLRADLAALGVPAGPPSAASAAYVQRVEQVAAASRPAFVAHHYVRYLADLSGGRLVGAALHRSLGLDSGNGGSAFAFDGMVPGEVVRSYRAALDALPLPPDERRQVVEESLLAYRLNAAVADELDVLLTPAGGSSAG